MLSKRKLILKLILKLITIVIFNFISWKKTDKEQIRKQNQNKKNNDIGGHSVITFHVEKFLYM